MASGPFEVGSPLKEKCLWSDGASTLVLPEVTSRAGETIQTRAPDVGIVYAWLAQGALTLSPLDAPWLVDFGFRLPGVLARHQLPAAGKCIASCGAVPSRPPEPRNPDDVTDRDLWAARFRRPGRGQLGEPPGRPEGMYHLVQDRDVIETILACELPPDSYYEELRTTCRRSTLTRIRFY